MAKGRDLSKMPGDIQDFINKNLEAANLAAAKEASLLLHEAYSQSIVNAGRGVKSADRPSYNSSSAMLDISGNYACKKYYGKSKHTKNEYAEDATMRPRKMKDGRLTRPVIHVKRITINNVLDLTIEHGIYGLPAYSENVDWINPDFRYKPSSISIDGISVVGATPDRAMMAFVDELAGGESNRMSKAFTETLFG